MLDTNHKGVNVSPKKLLNSKWTSVSPQQKEKHFVVIDVEYDEDMRVLSCQIEAVINRHCYAIDWRSLKDPLLWSAGWQ